MLAKFRRRYPQGSIVSELLDLDRGLYLVKVSIRVAEEILATGLAAAERVELAEDRARERALAALAIDTVAPQTETAATAAEEIAATPEVNSVVTQSPVPIANAGATAIETSQESISQQQYSSDEELKPATSTPTSELPSDSETTPDVENGNLFAGTFEAQPSPPPDFVPEPPPETSDFSESVSSQPTIEVNFEDIKHQTDIHLKRLGWTREDGVSFLKSRYGKRSRLHLKDEELLEFLHYLESQPTPK